MSYNRSKIVWPAETINLDKSSLKELENSKVIDLSELSIVKIDTDSFENCSVLKSLSLGQNCITEIDDTVFAKNMHLNELDLQRNCLKAINPNWQFNPTNFAYLNLRSNLIEEVNDYCLYSPTLTYLDLSHNKIKRIGFWAFRSLPNLTYLNLSNNKLKVLRMANANLIDLIVNANNLKFIEFYSDTLQVFRGRFNRFESLDNFSMLSNQFLIELDLMTDAFNAIDRVFEHSFRNVRLLQILKLNVQTFFAIESIMHLSKLNTFHLTYSGKLPLLPNDTPISHYFGKMTDFEHLTLILADYSIMYLNQMDKLAKLKTIHVECTEPKKNVDTLDIAWIFSRNKNLRDILLRNLHASVIPNVYDRKLTKSFARLKKLQLFGLHNKQITNCLRVFMFLEYLNLSYGKLRNPSFKGLIFLKHLYVDDCQMIRIDSKLFHDNLALECLSLSSNEIDVIEHMAFFRLKKLRFVDLRNNPLTELDDGVFRELRKTDAKIYLDKRVSEPEPEPEPQLFSNSHSILTRYDGFDRNMR